VNDHHDDPYAGFPRGFFDRADPTDDRLFYEYDRFVTHIDDNAIAAVGELYDELGINGRVLDLMSSWVSHFRTAPEALTVLGMNERELAANPQATDYVVHDLNADPTLPFDDCTFDDAVCCISIDYLVKPIEVFREVARVLVPNGRFVVTFSNRLFPTKAIAGWRLSNDAAHVQIVQEYFRRSGCFDEPTSDLRASAANVGDPLYAVWGTVVIPSRL
jgi:SAM-dependent methyltransferase